MGYQDPDMLITGSYDGDIVVWDIYTQKVIFVADSKCSKILKKQEGCQQRKKVPLVTTNVAELQKLKISWQKMRIQESVSLLNVNLSLDTQGIIQLNK